MPYASVFLCNALPVSVYISCTFHFGSRYDVTEWADRHPGGRYALEWARGSDVSGAFHTIHLFSARRVDQILAALPRVDGASENDEARPRIDSVPMTEQVVTKMVPNQSAVPRTPPNDSTNVGSVPGTCNRYFAMNPKSHVKRIRFESANAISAS